MTTRLTSFENIFKHFLSPDSVHVTCTGWRQLAPKQSVERNIFIFMQNSEKYVSKKIQIKEKCISERETIQMTHSSLEY